MNLSEVKEILSNQPKVFIVTHKSPDGDAMGSSLGLAGVLKAINCKVTVVAPTIYANFLKWIEGDEEVRVWGEHNEEIKKAAEEADLLFCLDFNALHRIDEVGDLVAKSNGKVIMIDHHREPEDFADLTISDITASSTAEMVYLFIEELGLTDKITPSLGAALYCGIMTDTGSFRFPSTTAVTHRVAGDIIKLGTDHALVHRTIYDSNSETRLRVLGHCLSTMEVLNEEGICIIKISKEDHKKYNIQKGDTEGIVNFGLSMAHVKCSAFFREDKDIVKISFRSKDDYDVNKLARENFNGGGHFNAAGGMSELTLEETIKRFKSIVQK